MQTNRLVSLMSWQWRMVRKFYAAVLGLFTAQQIAVLLFLAARKSMIGMRYSTLFVHGLQCELFLLTAVILACGVGICPWRTRDGARVGYTLLTLPFPRGLLLAANILLCMLLLIGLAAWQVVLFLAMSRPVYIVSMQVAELFVSGVAVPWSPYPELACTPLIAALLPTRAGSIAALIEGMLALSVGMACLFLHRGGWRILCGILTAVGFAAAILQAWAAGLSGVTEFVWPSALTAVISLLINLWWANRALKRATCL